MGVTVPIKSNVEYPHRATMLKVPPAVVKNSKRYPEYAEPKKDDDPTVTCLAIECQDVNRQPGNGPYPVKLDGTRLKGRTEGANLTLMMDGKDRKIPLLYSIESPPRSTVDPRLRLTRGCYAFNGFRCCSLAG